MADIATNDFPSARAAIVIGASGGIGSALVAQLQAHPAFDLVIPLHRGSDPPIDLTSEDSIQNAANACAGTGAQFACIINAAGMLHGPDLRPERSLNELNAAQLGRYFAVNAIGPAMVLKHFAPLLSRNGKGVFASLSARVGSISDNRLGGWYGYRASKAALNQLVRTAAIELSRTRPESVCVALHPGTVDTRLSAPFSKQGLHVRSPDRAAAEIMAVLEGLDSSDTGGFFDQHGRPVAW